MSGSPVFDVSGRVVEIHGQGDTVGTVQNESGSKTEEVKTRLNSAIPSNSFLELISEAGINKSEIKLDNKPPANVDAEKVLEGDVNNWVNNQAKKNYRG
jgi:serine protease Do